MILKQLQRLTLYASTRRNADVVRLARFYGSPAVCEPLTTSKAPRQQLSRDDRRVLVESFVNEYRAANDGKFPTYKATQKAVGGSYYVVKDIVQELKLKPTAPLPIVAKALLEKTASVSNDASSLDLKDPQSHVSAGNAKASSPIVANALSEESASVSNDASSQTLSDPQLHVSSSNAKEPLPTVPNALSDASASLPKDASSQALNDPQSHVFACNAKAPMPIVAKALSEESVSVPDDASSQALNDTDIDPQSHSSACSVKHLSAPVVDPGLQADSIETGGDQKKDTIDSSHPNANEINLHGNNLVATAAHGEETAPTTDVDSKCDTFESQVLIEEGSKNAETGKEENLSQLGSQEPKADNLEGTAISENIEPAVTRQVSEKEVVVVKTEEKSSAWSNIMSFAKGFADFWRKG